MFEVLRQYVYTLQLLAFYENAVQIRRRVKIRTGLDYSRLSSILFTVLRSRPMPSLTY